ncbi:MAG: tetratricopeptide repeat protein [Acidobacteriaceae bacterium]|nr:tetratricopeptide repeat protein [Acidobacteriaceae bacterium]
MRYSRALFLAFWLAAAPAFPSTVLVLQFQNHSQYSDLNWVGESIAETLMNEYAHANQIVFDRGSRAEAMHRLSLRPGATFTKATLIRLGQSLDATYICYGTYDINLPPGSSDLKDSSVQLSARFLDLGRMHDGPEASESGKLSELSRLEEHLAFATLKYLEPKANLSLDQFLAPSKLIRVDAEESYVRGLLSQSGDQQQKWFLQAAALDPNFSGPAFELGKLALQKKDYGQAITWLKRITPSDPSYVEAQFKLGVSAYYSGDYTGAANYFREVLKTYPLNEVYNNLGAAEIELNQPTALGDLHRAVDGDPNDPTYQFNLGAALWKSGRFDEAVKALQAVVDRKPDDADAGTLLERAQDHVSASSAKPEIPERLKLNFDATAFRQLKAMVQPKGSE